MDWYENIAETESLARAKVTCYCSQPEKKKYILIRNWGNNFSIVLLYLDMKINEINHSTIFEQKGILYTDLGPALLIPLIYMAVKTEEKIKGKCSEEYQTSTQAQKIGLVMQIEGYWSVQRNISYIFQKNRKLQGEYYGHAR